MKQWIPALLMLAAIALLPSLLVGLLALGAVLGWWIGTKLIAWRRKRLRLQAEFNQTWREAERRHRRRRFHVVK
jgi:hypothetical protein